jgi:hypothetical protein
LNSDDPIDELNDIIPDEDIPTAFHDPLDDLLHNNEILEAINPNLKLPGPQTDSQPSSFFSVRFFKYFSLLYLLSIFSFLIDIDKSARTFKTNVLIRLKVISITGDFSILFTKNIYLFCVYFHQSCESNVFFFCLHCNHHFVK